MLFMPIGRIRIALTLLIVISASCSGPRAKLFPTGPLLTKSVAGGQTDRLFDVDGDGTVDYAERLGSDGAVSLLRFDTAGDGSLDLELAPPTVNNDDIRHLVIILDSVPYEMVEQLRNQGRFRQFHPPSRVVSPFPVMTDLCLAEFFDVSPCIAVEARYYNNKRTNVGYGTYLREENSHWINETDYHLDFTSHGFVYTWPRSWFDRELAGIQLSALESDEDLHIAYSVGTSAMGARIGRNGHQAALIKLDRFCQWLIHHFQGRIQITLLSDHGHNLMRSEMLDLRAALSRCGYRVRDKLSSPMDVVLPEFGVVTYAGIHTLDPAAVAGDVVGIEGVEIAAYPTPINEDSGEDEIVVLSRTGRAKITKKDGRYRYACEFGDPLQLAPIVEQLKKDGAIDSQGFMDDERLFEASAMATYPDAIHRLWRAFHGLTNHTPDVLLSISDGYHCGAKFMADQLDLRAAHGNLNQPSSYAFVMSTRGKLKPVVRMEDLRRSLEQIGVPFDLKNGVVAQRPVAKGH